MEDTSDQEIANHVRNGEYKQTKRNPQLAKFPSSETLILNFHSHPAV